MAPQFLPLHSVESVALAEIIQGCSVWDYLVLVERAASATVVPFEARDPRIRRALVAERLAEIASPYSQGVRLRQSELVPVYREAFAAWSGCAAPSTAAALLPHSR